MPAVQGVGVGVLVPALHDEAVVVDCELRRAGAVLHLDHGAHGLRVATARGRRLGAD